MVRIRHREDGAPSYYGSDEVETEPGDVVDVDEATANRMLEWPYFVRDDEYDAPGQDAGGGDARGAVTTSDFRDDEVEVADEDSTGATEAQQEAGIRPGEADERDADVDVEQADYDTADFRDDEIDVADADSEGKTEAQQAVGEYEGIVDGTVDDVQAAIESGAVDDLDALEAAEREHGSERVGVMDAIESARESETETETDTDTDTETEIDTETSGADDGGG